LHMAHLSTLGWIVGFTLLGGVAGVLVASLFLLVPERSRARSLPLMVAFATGALLAAALLGLLPEAIEMAGPDNHGAVGLSLLAGIALFFILENWSSGVTATRTSARPTRRPRHTMVMTTR